MAILRKTALDLSDKRALLAKSINCQVHGDMTRLADEYSISRQTLYRTQEKVETALDSLIHDLCTPVITTVSVCKAQLRRMIVALSIESPNSIRAIGTLIPIIYPGCKACFGYIQGVIVEAQRNAAEFNRGVELSAILNIALDEMFSQGDPVLAGIDLYSGFLFSLSHESLRTGKTWQRVLQQAEAQGMQPDVVVKDGAKGIAKGVTLVYPDAQQRDDAFHAFYITGKAVRRVEQRAYYYIGLEEKAYRELGHINDKESYRYWSRLADKCERAIERYEKAAQAWRTLPGAFSSICRESGHLMTSKMAKDSLTQVVEGLRQAKHKESDKAATYLENRVKGLTMATEELYQKLWGLGQNYPLEQVELACRFFEAQREQKKASHKKQKALAVEMLGSYQLLFKNASVTNCELLMREVEMLLRKRYRASSAIEGFNAMLRTYLYTRKGVNQGFLELFKAWYNLRERRGGRNKGKSAYELMTGEKVEDWLTLIGFPPGNNCH